MYHACSVAINKQMKMCNSIILEASNERSDLIYVPFKRISLTHFRSQDYQFSISASLLLRQSLKQSMPPFNRNLSYNEPTNIKKLDHFRHSTWHIDNTQGNRNELKKKVDNKKQKLEF